jgi:hypothetical protein
MPITGPAGDVVRVSRGSSRAGGIGQPFNRPVLPRNRFATPAV